MLPWGTSDEAILSECMYVSITDVYCFCSFQLRKKLSSIHQGKVLLSLFSQIFIDVVCVKKFPLIFNFLDVVIQFYSIQTTLGSI